ncbi:MAG: TolC family protein, partial [Deltaproteobacteria bacterium]|nr:TolC family protein [Deltaproteobacteria bacterium]
MTRNGIFLSYRYVFLLVMLLGSRAAAGTEGEARLVAKLDLPGLVQEAAENNPEIKAARQRWEAAQAVIPQVQTLPDPRTTLSYQNVTERETMYGASQEVPFPGKLRLRGAVATRDAERLEQEYLAARLRIIA